MIPLSSLGYRLADSDALVWILLLLAAAVSGSGTYNVVCANNCARCVCVTAVCSVFVGCFYLTVSGFMTCLPVLNAMQSNAGDARRQGLLLGTTNSASNLVRSLGPILGGAVFSLSTRIPFPALVFLLLCCCYAVCFLMVRSLSPEDRQRINQPGET